MQKPIILRLKGTNSKEARELIKNREEELGIFFDDDFDRAAQKVVEVAANKSLWQGTINFNLGVSMVLLIYLKHKSIKF